MKRSLVFASIVILLTAVGSIAVAQGPGPGGGQGHGPGSGAGYGPGDGAGKGPRGGGLVRKLNRALEAAGAEALGPDQEECIAGEMEDFRANMPEFQGDGSGLELHQAYAQAVLSGNTSAVKTAAEDIALLMAEHTQRRLLIQAEFQMQILGCLTDGPGGQREALQNLDPKQQAWLVSSGAGGFGFARGRRGVGARNRPGRN